MRINVMSVLVDDQTKALRVYTEVLGFVKKNEVPLGEHSWLTVVSPDDPDGTELSLEPDEHPRRGRSSGRSWRMAFRSPRSRSATSPPSTSVSSPAVCGSPSPPPTWGP